MLEKSLMLWTCCNSARAAWLFERVGFGDGYISGGIKQLRHKGLSYGLLVTSGNFMFQFGSFRTVFMLGRVLQKLYLVMKSCIPFGDTVLKTNLHLLQGSNSQS